MSQVCRDAKDVPGKNASSLDRKMVYEVNRVTANMNVINVNVVTRNIITKEQVFQEKEPKKNKNITNWEEEKLKKTMVGAIQQLQKTQITMIDLLLQ
jgi:hypothetical protein